MISFHIRNAEISDIPQIADLFRATIQSVNTQDYTPEQIRIWSGSFQDSARWHEKFQTQTFLLAEEGKTLVGFTSISHGGYLDFMYVHRAYQGMGIASALLKKAEATARRQKNQAIDSDVSITARSFFEKRGFSIIREQRKAKDGVEFINFIVKKVLT